MIIEGVNLIDKLSKYKNDKIVILGHDCVDVDSIISGYLLEKILVSEGYNASFCILDKEITKESLDLCKEYGFDANVYRRNINGNKFILVDHNERKVDGEIITIIDHHPTSKRSDVSLYFNSDISSTSLYICKNNERYFDAKDIELAILALMLDTASFHSTKGREIDKEWVIDACKKYNLDYGRLDRSGIYLTDLSDVKQVSLNGLKKYNYNNKLVESSYIQIDDNKNNELKIKEILNILKGYVSDNNLEMFVFIVHDMINFKTKIYKIGKDNIKEVKYDKYTSRGSTIIPSIEKELMEVKYANNSIK